ncbi:MAG: molecular chaperone HtpG [Caldilineaceae bacterium]|nr:molecular chaperone HtpG [Caldilineaceae bacterium]
MTQETIQAPESLEYRTEVRQLLDILAHSLYTEREIFLRELISNSSDALSRIQFEMLTNSDVVDHDAELAITLHADRENKTLLISDSGIGMNRDELIENLGTIAHSGARSFLQSAKEQGKTLDEVIGQFGVGFYSVFMVAEEVTVTSRSYRAEDQAWTWRSTGESAYELTPADKTSRGTEILIKLKDDADEFANGWRLEQIVKKHSDYVSFPIYLLETKEVDAEDTDDTEGEKKSEETRRVLNKRTALWRQSPQGVEAEQYTEFYKQLTFDFEDPLLHIHLVTDAPVNMRSLLFIPSRRDRGLMSAQSEHGLRLYSRKILIQNRNRELLPDYFRFVEGVVDSEDLPLNVSREVVQSNPNIRHIRSALSKRIIRELKSLADAAPEKYASFWEQFGIFIKEGVASDPASQESLVALLRFHSSKSGPDEWVTLAQYAERMGSEQEQIFYVLGEDVKSVARSPHLDYFRANDIEVLYLVDPIDGYMTSMLREYEGKSLQNVDDAGLKLPEKEKAEAGEKVAQSDFDALVARVKQTLGERVVDVRESKQLVNNPCRLVSPENEFDRDMQRIRRLMEQDYETPKKILELNRGHELMKNLSGLVQNDADNRLIDATIEQLFANALLVEGIHPNPAEMVERIQMLMEAAVPGA